MGDSNAAIIRKAYQDFAHGNIPAVFATDGDLVVTLVTVKATRNGVSESFPEVHVWRMKNGRAIEFREYQGDEQREDRFWS